MPILADRYIEADTLSEAWLDAVKLVLAETNRKAVHLLIRILQPRTEIEAIREGAQGLIDQWNRTHKPKEAKPDIDTTRNTIFPEAWAERRAEPSVLADYYRRHYTKDGLGSFYDNRYGTYFGRIVAYPRGEDRFPSGDEADFGDQLTETVRKLRDELAHTAPKSSRYEVNIFNERFDRNPMSFPCLAHVSFHLHKGRLHMQAVYRNESLVARAYGNYLGLAQLQAYVSAAAGVQPGELLMTVNHVELDAGTITAARNLISDLG